MSRDKTPFGLALRGLAAREKGTLGAHPSLDEWAVYQEGKVAAEEAERLRDHLARCPKCTQLLMEWMSFAGPVPPEGARPIPKGEVEAAWKALRPQLQFPAGESATQPTTLVESPAPTLELPSRVTSAPAHRQPAAAGMPPRRRVPYWLPQTLAAVFFLTTVGLGIQVVKQRSVSLEGQPGLEAGFPVLDLHPMGSEERGGEPEDGPQPLFSDSTYQLFLHPDDPGSFSSYRYVVVEAEDPKQTIKETESPTTGDTFTLLVRKDEYPPGHYRVLLYGVRSGRENLIDQFEFKVKKR